MYWWCDIVLCTGLTQMFFIVVCTCVTLVHFALMAVFVCFQNCVGQVLLKACHLRMAKPSTLGKCLLYPVGLCTNLQVSKPILKYLASVRSWDGMFNQHLFVYVTCAKCGFAPSLVRWVAGHWNSAAVSQAFDDEVQLLCWNALVVLNDKHWACVASDLVP